MDENRCPACGQAPVEDVLCVACVQSGHYLTCPCGAWELYDSAYFRHSKCLGGWVVDEEAQTTICPCCRPEDMQPGLRRLPQQETEEEVGGVPTS